MGEPGRWGWGAVVADPVGDACDCLVLVLVLLLVLEFGAVVVVVVVVVIIGFVADYKVLARLGVVDFAKEA